MATIHIKPQQTDIYVMDGTILRDALLKNSIDIYKGMAKLLNCGGVGQCGTCVVEILTGAEQLSERTAVEEQKLRNKPVSYRLACQTVVSGELGVRVKP
ncbi:2Fe-2S iron-sulfur cluster-binding protein [Gloeobacter kilaueensis]|uniref:Ferredoxin n=1 Tax=Gloeobacter kilaueensis (strain ATCC BAA-2537 / CCAP 1431/1 / ULC 316 / JS1) TaxID=1183438 RepID=U5QI92_GLOK1|nr:2Fe-2S iron-sulfur cluster-binding protein [Gloeobacter kilaueensis]AGY57304.1 ferredoxin [Gloeobacter kilaueensis JS1]